MAGRRVAGKEFMVALQDMVTALADHWDDVVARLRPEVAADLTRLVETVVATAPDSDDAIDAAIDLAALLLGELPADHPVAAAARAGGEYRLSSNRPGDALAVPSTLLVRLGAAVPPEILEPQQILAAVRRRLLQAPSLSEREVAARGHDPGQRALIRLKRPDGTMQWPVFQFDPSGAPIGLVLQINASLGADRDPWGVADWWLGENAWLNDVPARLIGVLDDAVLVATADTMMED